MAGFCGSRALTYAPSSRPVTRAGARRAENIAVEPSRGSCHFFLLLLLTTSSSCRTSSAIPPPVRGDSRAPHHPCDVSMLCIFTKTLSASARQQKINKSCMQRTYFAKDARDQAFSLLPMLRVSLFFGVTRNTSAAHHRVPKRFSPRFKTPTSSGASKRLSSIFFF